MNGSVPSRKLTLDVDGILPKVVIHGVFIVADAIGMGYLVLESKWDAWGKGGGWGGLILQKTATEWGRGVGGGSSIPHHDVIHTSTLSLEQRGTKWTTPLYFLLNPPLIFRSLSPWNPKYPLSDRSNEYPEDRRHRGDTVRCTLQPRIADVHQGRPRAISVDRLPKMMSSLLMMMW